MLVLFVIVATLVPGRADDDAADLKKAQDLFPVFRESVYTDQKKAYEAFDALVDISPLVQKRLLTWLDQEYADKLSAYRFEKGGDNVGPVISADDLAELKQLRGELETIRTMANEDEMKKVLKEKAWPILEKLLRLNRSTIRSLGMVKKSAVVDSLAVRSARRKLEQVGEFRYELRKQIGLQAVKVEDELDGVRSDEEKDRIEAIEHAASVMKKNEQIKDQIPDNEYDGILELNHWRIAAGMQPLLIDPKLCDAARDHCKDMADLGFFAHQSPVEGKTSPWDRARNFGTSASAENIAINHSTEGANKAWFYSPGHHKNMFNPKFSVMGLGNHGRHFTQMFR